MLFKVPGQRPLGLQIKQESAHEASEQPLHETLSEARESLHADDTPSKRIGGKPRCMKKTSPTSAAKSQRPPLERQSKIEDTSRHYKSRIPGTFESQDADIDMESEYSGSESLPTMDESKTVAGAGTRNQSAVADSTRTTQTLSTTKPTGTIDPQTNEVKFWVWKSAKELREINNNIYLCIKSRHAAPRQPIKKAVKRPPPGWIYVFESPEKAPAKVKIGKTKKDPQKRKVEWELCGLPLMEVGDSYKNAFDHYSVVESLIKAELHNERRKHTCPHHASKKWVEHEEWYEIDKQTALKSVHRWRHWIIQQAPFDENGHLTPYWHWRVEKLPRFINDVDWDTWTQPKALDYLVFQFEQFGQGKYTQFKAHLSRKDFRFCLTGGMMVFVLYTQFGIVGLCWGILALFIL